MKNFCLFISGCILFVAVNAQPVISFSPVISSGLSGPVDIVNSGDGSNRLFIVQQDGIIKILSGNVLLSTAFLNVSGIINYDGAERGLLSLVFHPGYASNRYFFIYYNNTAGDIVVAQYRTFLADPNIADPTSANILMTIPKPFSNHNGGKLNFGADGNLYFGTGDGGSGGDPNNLSQNGVSLLGKMIRINVDNFTTPPYFTVPADNPFVGNPSVSDSVFALGLRNPWRWSFDRQTGDMWIADVGQNAWEEVNFRNSGNMAGVNYGWRCYEGTHDYNLSSCGSNPSDGKVFPVFEYPHNSSTGGFSVTGGYVYRGAEFPSLQGYYICIDYSSGNCWLIKPNGSGGWNITMQPAVASQITSFGESENGTLYAISRNGVVYKVTASPVTDVNNIADDLNAVSLSPNPARERVMIKASSIISVNIYDMWGRSLLQKNFGGFTNTVEINTGMLKQGTYIVEITGRNTVSQTLKLIRQ